MFGVYRRLRGVRRDSGFVVKAVNCGKTRAGTRLVGKTAQGQFCVVDMSIKNIGKEPQLFTVDAQKGFAGSTQFSPDGEATLYMSNQNVWLAEINPGNAITGPVVFDVPAGVTLTRVELHDSMFSGGVDVRLS